MRRNISALETASRSQSSGQLSNTVCAISPAESDGLNRNSFVLPLTSIKRKFILSDGIVLLNFCVITAPPLLLTTDGVVTMAAFTVEPAAPMAPTAETEPVLEQQDDDEPDEHTDTSV